MISASLNHCKGTGAEPGRRFLKQPATKLETVIVDNINVTNDCENLVLLQPLCWRCTKCTVHHERNVCEEQHDVYVARTSKIRDYGV